MAVPRTSNGNVAPTRNVTWPLANMRDPVGIYLDTTNNRIYIAENNEGDKAMLAFNNADTIDGKIALVVRSILQKTSKSLLFPLIISKQKNTRIIRELVVIIKQ